MKVITGCLIVRDNKILMVKEANKRCYGQWNIPAGYVENAEKITDAAIRESYEETGRKVRLKGVLTIGMIDKKDDESRIMVTFTAEIIEENVNFNTEEILDIQWIDIEKVKKMTNKELRDSEIKIDFIKNFEENKIYPLEIFNNKKYIK